MAKEWEAKVSPFPVRLRASQCKGNMYLQVTATNAWKLVSRPQPRKLHHQERFCLKTISLLMILMLARKELPTGL